MTQRGEEGGLSESEATKRIVPTHIGHFVIRSKNVKQLTDWYCCVLHANIIFQNENVAFLYFDDEHHRIVIGDVPGLEPPNPKAAGFDHVAFSYAAIEDLLNTYIRLKEAGINPYYKIDHGPTTSLYYADPDGNQIEMQVDNFETCAEAHDYFRSEAFNENQLGVEIDPEELVRRWKAGAPPRSLLSSGTRPGGT